MNESLQHPLFQSANVSNFGTILYHFPVIWHWRMSPVTRRNCKWHHSINSIRYNDMTSYSSSIVTMAAFVSFLRWNKILVENRDFSYSYSTSLVCFLSICVFSCPHSTWTCVSNMCSTDRWWWWWWWWWYIHIDCVLRLPSSNLRCWRATTYTDHQPCTVSLTWWQAQPIMTFKHY